MSNIEKALATQLSNIEAKTGKSLKQLLQLIGELGDLKHKQKVTHLKESLDLGYGDANTLVHYAKKATEENSGDTTESNNPLDSLYVGKKEHLRPIHDKLLTAINQFL